MSLGKLYLMDLYFLIFLHRQAWANKLADVKQFMTNLWSYDVFLLLAKCQDMAVNLLLSLEVSRIYDNLMFFKPYFC